MDFPSAYPYQMKRQSLCIFYQMKVPSSRSLTLIHFKLIKVWDYSNTSDTRWRRWTWSINLIFKLVGETQHPSRYYRCTFFFSQPQQTTTSHYHKPDLEPTTYRKYSKWILMFCTTKWSIHIMKIHKSHMQTR